MGCLHQKGKTGKAWFLFHQGNARYLLEKKQYLEAINNIKAKWKWDICLVLIGIWSAGTRESIITKDRTTTINPGQESQDIRNLNNVKTESKM